MGVWGRAVEVERAPSLADRVEHGRVALAAHAASSGIDEEYVGDQLVHLLCDLMHVAQAYRHDFAALLRAAEQHYCEELLRAGQDAQRSRPPHALTPAPDPALSGAARPPRAQLRGD